MTTFIKMVLAVIVGTLATAGIIFAVFVGITYFETQKLKEEISNTRYNSNIPSSDVTPPECVNDPNSVFCQLELAKQKIRNAQDANNKK